jgi:hypothetical protein
MGAIVERSAKTRPGCERLCAEIWRRHDGPIIERLFHFLYPSIFKEDPRYYRMGEGSFQHRLMHAMSHIIIAHRNSGVAEFNFSEWFGLTSSVALRNLYHPDRLRGFQPAAGRVERGLASDMATDIFREFWPEISRKLKIPFVSRDRSQDGNPHK